MAEPQPVTSENLGEHVRALREAKGISPEMLAIRLQGRVSANTIRSIERGAILKPGPVTLKHLARVLDGSFATFMELAGRATEMEVWGDADESQAYPPLTELLASMDWDAQEALYRVLVAARDLPGPARPPAKSQRFSRKPKEG